MKLRRDESSSCDIGAVMAVNREEQARWIGTDAFSIFLDAASDYYYYSTAAADSGVHHRSPSAPSPPHCLPDRAFVSMKQPLLASPEPAEAPVVVLLHMGAPEPSRPRYRLRLLLFAAVCATAIGLLYCGSRDDDDEDRRDWRRPRNPLDAPAPAFHSTLDFADRKLRLKAPELTFLVVGDWGRQGTYQDKEVRFAVVVQCRGGKEPRPLPR